MDHVGALLLGLGNGGVYAALALALVLTYRSSGVINFATGAVALYVAYVYAFLRKGELLLLVPGPPAAVGIGTELGLVPAALIALAFGAFLGVLLYLLVFRPLREAPPLARAVASLGVLVVIQSAMATRLGTAPVSVKAIFPARRWEFGSLTVLVAVAWGVARLRTSRLGSAMLAIRANERSAAGIGINVVRVKIASFALASFIAGLGGSLLAYRSGSVTYDSFTSIGGLTLLSTAYLAGVTSVFGGINAGIAASSGIVFVAMDRWVHLGDWFPVLSGLAVIAVLIGHPEGIASSGHDLAVFRSTRRRGKGRMATPVPEALSAPVPEPAPVAAVPAAPDVVGRPTGAGVSLEVSGLTVHYGGVLAVSEVSLRVAPGSVVGLIGPNGAGKTSVIDAVTGFARASGSVLLGGAPIERLPPHSRVHRGLARTFQSLDLYDDLTVAENVGAATARLRGHEALAGALELLGIADRAERPAGKLSHGERQLVSIARGCATGPAVLLLDSSVVTS